MNKIFLLFFIFFYAVFYCQITEKDSIAIDSGKVILEAKKFDPKFKEKYNDDAFEYEPKINKNSTWEQFKAWLKNLLKSLFDLEKGSEETVDLLIRIGVFILILLVVAFIVKAILNKETSWIFGKSSSSIIDEENIETKIHEANFDQLIKEKLEEKDYRLAIRFYYLFLLKKLSDSKIIDWEINKTNADYSYEIQNDKVKSKFDHLSYLYEYIWYGEFEVSEDKYLQVIQQFKEVVKII